MTISKRCAVAFAVLGLGAVPIVAVSSSAGNDEPAAEIEDGTLISPANDKEAHVPIWFTL